MSKAKQAIATDNENALYERIRALVVAARQTVARGVDLVQVRTNFEIGRHIVEHEQQGEQRAAYGREVIKQLAEQLAREFGDGFSARNLASMRAFFLCYRERNPSLQTLSANSLAVANPVEAADILQTLSAKLPGQLPRRDQEVGPENCQIGQALSDQSSSTCSSRMCFVKLAMIENVIPFALSLSKGKS
jgi:hypothetical protein